MKFNEYQERQGNVFSMKSYIGWQKRVITHSFVVIFHGNKKKEKTMTFDTEFTQFNLAMELLIEYGFEGIADAVGRSERSTKEVDLKEISEFVR